jgi:3-oxoacyl-[acyl-carrier-protein] synthase-3
MSQPRIYSRIVGTGHYLPERIVTNKDLEAFCDTTDEWIRERTGIEQRHFAAEGEGCLDLAYQASIRAIDDAGVTASDIDLVIVASATSDYRSPSVAAMLQDKLGCNPVMSFDLQAACTGFLYGLHTVDQFVRAGTSKCVLLVGAERLSGVMDFEDRSTAVLFGDGAGAVIIQPSDETGLLASNMYSDGSKAGILGLMSGVPVYEPADQANKVYMKGQEVFKAAVKGMGDSIVKTMDDAGLSLKDVDWLVPHQANMRIIQSVGKRLKIDEDKVVINVQQTANTSASTVPIALDRAIKDGRIKRGDTIIATAFGAGLVWGSAALTL